MNFVGVLSRHQTKTKLRSRLGRQHRLGSFALIPGPHPIDVKRRSPPTPFKRRKASFAEQFLHTQFLFELVVRKTECVELTTFFVRQFDHVIVKTGHLNSAFVVLDLGQHLRERIRGVIHRPAEGA